MSFKVEPGQVLALVGKSGCGKSTTATLLQRFYDPTAGTVTLDGVGLPEYSLKWLRSHIGLVQQTPVLMPTTIYQNIAIGKAGATKDEVEAAAMQASTALA